MATWGTSASFTMPIQAQQTTSHATGYSFTRAILRHLYLWGKVKVKGGGGVGVHWALTSIAVQVITRSCLN
jgi:hypothetical protein